MFLRRTFLLLLLLSGATPATGQGSGAEVYNFGIELYRSEKFAEAAERFQQAAASPDPELAAKARYNLGNSLYAQALLGLKPANDASQTPRQPVDPPQAIGLLESAIAQYRVSLCINLQDDDARANIELASRLLKELKQQQEQDKQEQDKQESDKQEDDKQPQDQPEQEKQASGEQENSQQNAEQNKQQQPEQGEQKDQAENPDSSESSQESSDDSKGNEPPQDSQQPSQESTPKLDARQQTDPADGEDTGPLRKNDGNQTPEGELTTANEPTDKQPPPQQEAAEPIRADQMTDQEARKLLQAIRDRDLLRRYQRQAAERSRRIPVARDW